MPDGTLGEIHPVAEVVEPPARSARVAISLPPELLAAFDNIDLRKGRSGRSRRIAELMRQSLSAGSDHIPDGPVAGTITVVSQHGQGRTGVGVMRILSRFVAEVVCSQSVVLDAERALDVLVVRGSPERLQQLCDALQRVRSVRQIARAITPAA